MHSNVFENIVFIKRLLREVFSYVKIKGFTNCSPDTSQVGDSLSQMSVKTFEYYGPDGPLKYFLDALSSLTICLHLKSIISDISTVIEIIWKLSFKNGSGCCLLCIKYEPQIYLVSLVSI